MINFTGGLIKCGSIYIPSSNITKIASAPYGNNQAYITISNQTEGNKEYFLEGSPEKWAKAYTLAESQGKIIDIII